nr:hypothetical protein [Tanacetum cinerariifolium]
MASPFEFGAFGSTLPIMVIVALRAQRFRSSVRKTTDILLDHIRLFRKHPIAHQRQFLKTLVIANHIGVPRQVNSLQSTSCKLDLTCDYVVANMEYRFNLFKPLSKTNNSFSTLEVQGLAFKEVTIGKPHGKLIWKSIQNGPTPHPQTTDPAPEGGAVPPPRNKRDEEFTEEDNINELADIQAINILSQGLPRRIFNILNQNEIGREIWVNLELLMKGSGQTLERRKEALFDEFKHFRTNGIELIQDYFVCFHKLVNDMKVTQLDIPTHHLNTKFANNLPSYWGKYVTHAKNNMNMSTITYVKLFTHLRTYEEHALKTLKKKEQSSVVVDPLAYLAKTTPTHSTTSPVTVPTPQSSGDSHNDAMLATMDQITNLLSGLQTQRAPGNTRTKGIQTTGSGVNNSGKKEKGAVLDAKAEAFLADVECTAPYDQPLALTTTNLFEANHEDAYDSDVDEGPYAFAAFMANLSSTAKEKGAVLDAEAEAFLADVEYEGPHASVAFMANLSSTGGTNGSSSSHINEVQFSDDSFFSDVSYLLAQEMQQEEHLNFKVDSVLDDNMITYDQYQNDSRVEAVPTVVSADEVDKQSMIAVLQRMHTEIDGYALECNKVKHDIDMAIVERNKRNAELEEDNMMLKSTLKSKVVSIENIQQESKQVYWLLAAEIASQSSTLAKPVAPFVHTRPVKSDVHKKLWKIKECITAFEKIIKERTAPPPSILSSHQLWHHTKECFDEQITPFFNNIKQVFQTLDTNIFQEVKEFERIFDELDAEYERILLEKKNMQIEKKNLLIMNECLIANSIANDICSIVLAYDLVMPPLKEQLQGRDNSIRNLQAQNDIMSLLNVGSTDDSCNKQALETELTQLKHTVTSFKIQNDGYNVTNTNLDRCYEELSKANTHLRTTSLEKIAAQKAEIATLNAKTVGNKTSGITKPVNPKVIAPGMYTISPKYIVPQRRTNRETLISLPKKKQVTFQETPKLSPRFTKKPVASLLNKT